MSGWILVIALLFANFAGATSIDATVTCPDAFVGVVEKIIDSQTSFTPLVKQDVVFNIQEVIKGNLDHSITIKSLKFGPNKFEVGQQYRLELRHKRICRITKL